MPRHIGHSDEEWTELLEKIEDVLWDHSYLNLSTSEARLAISDFCFSVGQKAYMAGYHAGLKEKAEQSGKKA